MGFFVVAEGICPVVQVIIHHNAQRVHITQAVLVLDVVIEAGDLRGNGSRCADTGNRAVAVPPRLAKIAENQSAFVSEIPVKENILRLDVPVKNMSLHTDLEKRKQVVSAPDGKLHVVRGVVVP